MWFGSSDILFSSEMKIALYLWIKWVVYISVVFIKNKWEKEREEKYLDRVLLLWLENEFS